MQTEFKYLALNLLAVKLFGAKILRAKIPDTVFTMIYITSTFY